MKKRLLILLLALLPVVVITAKKTLWCGKNVTYEFDKVTGTLTISGSGPMKDYSYYNGKTAPWLKNKYQNDIKVIIIKEGVTSIGDDAFRYCEKLESITIPQSVTSIGSLAFLECRSLKSVVLPDKITNIEGSAFERCYELTEINIPSSLTTIKGGTFSNCNLISVVIPSNITTIEDFAFSRNKNLVSVTFPNSHLTTIGDYAFHYCIALKSITIPSSIMSIGRKAFNDCKSLKSVNILNNQVSIKEEAFPFMTIVRRNVESAEEKVLIAKAHSNSSEEKRHEPVIQKKEDILVQQAAATQQKTHLKSQPDVQPIPQKKLTPQPIATPQVAQPKTVVTNVDLNIFVSNKVDRNTFAVIIGNEKYDDEADVPFAENDAKIFGEYCQKTLGISEKHIRLITNAGFNDIRKAVSWLKQGMEAYGGEGRVIFYYAGHGIPDEKTQNAYLLPSDGIGNDIESAYSLNKLYQALSELPAQSVTVFLDACFSGAKREGGMLASARGVAIKAKPAEAKGKMVIFTAAQGDETAYPFKSQRHGMFTYYLLKKLQETKGLVTLGELGDYLKREVKRESFDENNKMQTPSVTASPALQASWRSMKLK